MFQPSDELISITEHLSDFEFYKTSDCSGTVFARSFIDLDSFSYTALELGSFSEEIRGVKARPNTLVTFSGGESISGEVDGSFGC